MKKSITVKPKRGRPPSGGRDPLMGFRASPVLRASIVKWAESQHDNPTLSDAIRRLVELGLTHPKSVRTRSKRRSTRAKQLAAATLDKLVDPSTPVDEVADRKRKLLKGPEEFRQSRIDHEHSE
jgi:hypothetical protein